MIPFAEELDSALEPISKVFPSDNDPYGYVPVGLKTELESSEAVITSRLALHRLSSSIYGVDLPGHGLSSSVQTGPWETAGSLGKTFGRGVYIGYSMGARICLYLALSSPELIEALILVSGSAGIEDEDARIARKSSDDALAISLEEGRPDLATFLERWTEQPLFSTLPAQSRMIAERMTNTPAGLSSSLRLCGAGACDSLWGRLHELAMPVHCIAGMLDGRYSYYALRMARLIGANATVSLVQSAGHACYAERPKLASLLIANLLGH